LTPRARHRLARGAATCPDNPCLTFHGGAVLHGHKAYLIYWQPSNGGKGVQPFPAGYQAATDTYMARVAAAAGSHDNVYSVATQYSDSNGPASYGVSYAPVQSLSDTDPLPASGCDDPGLSGNACMTDSQLQDEIDTFVQSRGLPRGLGAIYFLVTPPGFASCTEADASKGCYNEHKSASGYCAYHGDFNLNSHGVTLYANMPYAGVPLCQTGDSPPDHPNNTSADDLASVLSHEQIEVMTDPQSATGKGGWLNDATGQEIGDLCSRDYGSQLASTPGGPYNQLIAGGVYELQTEWSNKANACAGSLPNGP
jgi:hypothetical protein